MTSLAGFRMFCLILLGISVLGMLLGVFLGLEAVSTLPSLRAATSRAILIARILFHALQSLGLDYDQALILSLGLGIFANNTFTVIIILLSPMLILWAKPLSDRHLARLYYDHGIWLFKPVSWKIFRILSLILPTYALGLQFYLIGGALLLHGPNSSALGFLAIETTAVTCSCILALLPGLSRQPLQYLKDYTKILGLATSTILACLFAAAVLEAHQLLLLTS